MKDNLILLHGALGSKAQFSKLQNLLSQNFHVHSFNFEGHGESPSDNEFSIELFTQNTLQFMLENNIEKSHFFGYSMGGYVALNLARNHPEKIQKILTLATKFNWTPDIAAKEIKMLNPEKIEVKVPKFAEFLKFRHHPSDWKIVMQKTANMMDGLGDGKALTIDELRNIETEVLVCIGDLDKMVSIEESENAVNALPNGKLNIIEGVEHVFEKINVNKIINQFEDFFA